MLVLSATKSRLLGFDCSAGAVSAAVWHDDGIVAFRRQEAVHGQGEILLPLLAQVMADCQTDFGQLGAVAVTEGPGSFTGIRVGLAAARGIALGLDIPVIGISAFDAVVAAADWTDFDALMVVIDSRRNELFCQSFDRTGDRLGEPRLIAKAELSQGLPPGRVLVTGDGASFLLSPPQGVVVRPSPAPDARDVVRLAVASLRLGMPDPAVPIYIRPPDATVPSGGGRIR